MIELLSKYKLIPVLIIHDETEFETVFSGMQVADLPIAEITLRTEFSYQAILLAKQKYPSFLIGAGTVINKEQAKKVIGLGVDFIVSPGFDKKVAKLCNAKKVLYIPGVITPTEIIKAMKYQLKILKFFPASAFGGVATLKAYQSPFHEIKFVPTGGINESNISEYLSQPNVLAVGSSAVKGKSKEEVVLTITKLKENIK